jgi:hypothetical protein
MCMRGDGKTRGSPASHGAIFTSPGESFGLEYGL